MTVPFLVDELTAFDFAAADEPPIGLLSDLAGGREDMLALRVSGDPMAGALVMNGDIIILAASAEPHDGDLVVARVSGYEGQEVPALGRLYHQNGRLRLQPADSNGPSACYDPDQLTIEGRIVLIMRQLG